MKKKLIITGIIVLLVLLIAVPRFSAKGSAAKPVRTAGKLDEETIFAVNTHKVIKGRLYNYIEVNGEIEAETNVYIYPDISGKLLRLYVSPGDYVKKGAVVAEVDPSKPGTNYEPSPVKSTISGTITESSVEIGSTVSTSTGIVRVGHLEKLEIKTTVAEKYVSKIKLNQRAILAFDAFPGESFEAYISEISPVVDPDTRTMEITLKFKNSENRIKSGMFSQIKIVIENKQGVVKIPTDAIVSRFGESYVFVLNDDLTVEKRTVQTGIEIDNISEILEGLDGSEMIIVRGQTLLEDKAKVKVVSEISLISQEMDF